MEHIRIIAPGDPGFDWLYDPICRAFPSTSSAFGSGRRGCWAIRVPLRPALSGETRVGLLMWWAGPGFRYVEHFHRPAAVGQSWGSRALREFLAEGDPVVLEIDPPEDPVSRRRKGFYEGLGLVSNPWPHIHPPYRLEFSGHALEVMTFPGGWDEGQYRRFARYLDETVMADRPQKVAGA